MIQRVCFESIPDYSRVLVNEHATDVSEDQLAALILLLPDIHLITLLVSCVLIKLELILRLFDRGLVLLLTCRFVLSRSESAQVSMPEPWLPVLATTGRRL